jgi:hypothetical protein
MPSQISVSVSWVANGARAATLFRPVDDIGAVSSLIFRTRPATASVGFTGVSRHLLRVVAVDPDSEAAAAAVHPYPQGRHIRSSHERNPQ